MSNSIERNLEQQFNSPELLEVTPSEAGIVEGEIHPNSSHIVVPDPSDSVKSNIEKPLPIVPEVGGSLSRSPLDPDDAGSFCSMITAKTNGIGPEEYSKLPLAA